MKKLIMISTISGILAGQVFANPLERSSSIKEALVVQNAMREIYQEVNPAVVRIETEETVTNSNPFFSDPRFRYFFDIPKNAPDQKRQGLGSGFIISNTGFIVTNYHVVGTRGPKKYVDKIKVKLVNGNSYEAEVIGADQASDIALLKITPKETLKVVHIGDSDKVEVGDFAIAIGNPFGLSSTFTMGVISSKGQEIQSPDGISRIQTDAPINPGNSGGPLLNLKGEVVGINQMIYSRSGGSIGIGFAIPVNYAMDVVEKLKKGEKIKHGYIGVSIIPSPTKAQIRELDLKGKTGLLVAQVKLGSPAWNAGLRPYDFITNIDAKKAETFSDLKSAVVKRGVGNKLRISAIRSGKKKTFIVTIGEAKSDDD